MQSEARDKADLVLYGYSWHEIRYEMTWGDFQANIQIMRVKQEVGQLLVRGLYPSYEDQSELPVSIAARRRRM